MINENLILTCLSPLIILVLLLQTSHANQNPYCETSSSCGIIHNITYPFRLRTDPKHCGDTSYELACENNVTSIYLNSQKYNVQAINYHNFTIRLTDVAIKNDSCSFPRYSVYGYNFTNGYPYSISSYRGTSSDDMPDIAWPITFLSCQYQLKNSSFLTEITTHCANKNMNVFDPTNRRHAYVKVGHMKSSDLEDMCRIDLIVMTSWKFKDLNNISVSEIHNSLLYGFELSWFGIRCSKCGGGLDCYLDGDIVTCGRDYCPIYFTMRSFNCKHIRWFFNGLNGTILILLLIIGVSIAARIIIGFPCIMGLIIYKFRRRHLSTFDVIEGYLQSDNNLIPIRYSYSDIKKMTRAFRQKLGQGGYGSVYKGTLRSGHHVAVKLLSSPRSDGQDFINEVATIGRIHHVNVVKLVGYCAERSKRALVYDFMPNGSLEKYIFDNAKMISLRWETKFEVAIGVARGICYLHRGCDIQILHFDIKPHNILLDDNFIPKISDFGLAKFCSIQKNTVTITAARGTIGYVAPELINRCIGGVSYKADVYSFGMLLMEIVGLKRDLVANDENSSQYFPYWIYDRFNKGDDIEIIGIGDENENEFTRKITRKMIIVALWCIQMNPGDRPSMNRVVEMLEGEVELLQVPVRPSQSVRFGESNEDQTWGECSTDSVLLICGDGPSDQ